MPIHNISDIRRELQKMKTNKSEKAVVDALTESVTALSRFVSGMFSIVNWGYLKVEDDTWMVTEDDEDIPFESGDAIVQVYSVTSGYLSEDDKYVLTEDGEGTIVEYNTGMSTSEMEAIPIDDELL